MRLADIPKHESIGIVVRDGCEKMGVIDKASGNFTRTFRQTLRDRAPDVPNLQPLIHDDQFIISIVEDITLEWSKDFEDKSTLVKVYGLTPADIEKVFDRDFMDGNFNVKDIHRIIVLTMASYIQEKLLHNIWNQEIPLGYRQTPDGLWIERIEEAIPMIKAIFETFVKLKDFDDTADAINGKYRDILKQLNVYPLTGDKIEQILNDPVYIGKPVLRRDT